MWNKYKKLISMKFFMFELKFKTLQNIQILVSVHVLCVEADTHTHQMAA